MSGTATLNSGASASAANTFAAYAPPSSLPGAVDQLAALPLAQVIPSAIDALTQSPPDQRTELLQQFAQRLSSPQLLGIVQRLNADGQQTTAGELKNAVALFAKADVQTSFLHALAHPALAARQTFIAANRIDGESTTQRAYRLFERDSRTMAQPLIDAHLQAFGTEPLQPVNGTDLSNRVSQALGWQQRPAQQVLVAGTDGRLTRSSADASSDPTSTDLYPTGPADAARRATVMAKIVALGGERPRFTPLPVVYALPADANGQGGGLRQTALFKVQGTDGFTHFVDDQGSDYANVDHFLHDNHLPVQGVHLVMPLDGEYNRDANGHIELFVGDARSEGPIEQAQRVTHANEVALGVGIVAGGVSLVASGPAGWAVGVGGLTGLGGAARGVLAGAGWYYASATAADMTAKAGRGDEITGVDVASLTLGAAGMGQATAWFQGLPRAVHLGLAAANAGATAHGATQLWEGRQGLSGTELLAQGLSLGVNAAGLLSGLHTLNATGRPSAAAIAPEVELPFTMDTLPDATPPLALEPRVADAEPQASSLKPGRPTPDTPEDSGLYPHIGWPAEGSLPRIGRLPLEPLGPGNDLKLCAITGGGGTASSGGTRPPASTSAPRPPGPLDDMQEPAIKRVRVATIIDNAKLGIRHDVMFYSTMRRASNRPDIDTTKLRALRDELAAQRPNLRGIERGQAERAIGTFDIYLALEAGAPHHLAMNGVLSPRSPAHAAADEVLRAAEKRFGSSQQAVNHLRAFGDDPRSEAFADKALRLVGSGEGSVAQYLKWVGEAGGNNLLAPNRSQGTLTSDDVLRRHGIDPIHLDWDIHKNRSSTQLTALKEARGELWAKRFQLTDWASGGGPLYEDLGFYIARAEAGLTGAPDNHLYDLRQALGQPDAELMKVAAERFGVDESTAAARLKAGGVDTETGEWVRKARRLLDLGRDAVNNFLSHF
jgi:hypothetical protein